MIELETDGDGNHLLIDPNAVVHFAYEERDDGVPGLEVIYSSGTSHLMDVELANPERAKELLKYHAEDTRD